MIVEENLKVAVSIHCGDSTATGWLLRRNGFLFVVTATHVIFTEHNGEIVLRNPTINVTGFDHLDEGFDKAFYLKIQAAALLDAGLLQRSDEPSDVAVFLIGKAQDESSFTFHPLTDVSLQGPIHPIFVTEGAERLFRDLRIGLDVVVAGFPTSLERHKQLIAGKPLVTSGIVASIYGTNGRFAIDAPVFPGNSGGPVFERRVVLKDGVLAHEHKVIGTISEYVPWLHSTGVPENSGYSIVEPVDLALGLASHILSRIKK